MDNYHPRNLLFIVDSWKKHKRIREDIDTAINEKYDNIFVLSLDGYNTMPTTLGNKVIPVNVIDFANKKYIREIDNNAYALVNNLKNDLKKHKLYDYFKVEGVSLFKSCEVELHLYYISKILDQISLTKNIIEKLKISGMRIYGNFENFISLRNPPFLTTYLWGAKIASELSGLKVTFYEKWKISGQVLLGLFLIWGSVIRISLQAIRTIKTKKYRAIILNKKRRVISISHALPNAITIVPVLEELKRIGYDPIVLQAGGITGTECFNNIDFVNYEIFFNLNAAWYSFKNLPKLLFGLIKLYHSSLWQNIKILSPSLGQLFKRLFIQFAVTRFTATLCYVAMHIEIMKHLNPEVILLTQEWNSRERSLCLAAKKFNCKTVMLQCGLYSDYEFYKYDLCSDLIALESKQAKDTFIKLGHVPQKIFITGQPAHIWLRKNISKLNKEELYKELKIDIKYPIVLYGHQCYEEPLAGLDNKSSSAYLLYERNLNEVYEGFKMLLSKHKFYLIIKPHPREYKKLHEDIIKRINLSNTVLLSPRDNPYRFLGISNVFISKYSTLAMESLAVGVPVIILKDDREISTPFFEGCESAFTVDNFQSLETILKRIFYSDETWHEKCENFFRIISKNQYSRAAENVVKLIEEFC